MRATRLRAVFIFGYLASLGIIQTQWAFYLCLPFLYVGLMGVILGEEVKGWKQHVEQVAWIFVVLAAGVGSRWALDDFDNIRNLDDLIFNKPLWVILAVAIPVALVTLAKKLATLNAE